ncbi:hypothetical protein N781_03390 [Pontibacillus halophilus JSM 076056 = DSM 19796]|uniref:DNA-directed RNA polymerase subunit epsilon n=1 Tax=Pontibacillus halophilus JSM 076056 = DSM 19796 TaxID=1385510 RepID=A0A0A5GHT7_9BACI|nr:DNA-directed RNA polymerase subunit epsilon [Pontibacillus halophilus]KGX91549.1 hypothetical protein N781_03390 [Pontibacillus halophilus JSM 076056 = DSM 19796]
MIYKVLHQSMPEQVPVRERTTALYIEGESERDVRYKLADRQINIEYIQLLQGDHLEYEQQSEDFKLENI